MGILARRFWIKKNRSQLTAPMQSIDITMALFQGHIDPPELMGSYNFSSAVIISTPSIPFHQNKTKRNDKTQLTNKNTIATTATTNPNQSIFPTFSLQLPVTGLNGNRNAMQTKHPLAMIGGVQKIHLQASPPLLNISAAINGPVQEPNPITALKIP